VPAIQIEIVRFVDDGVPGWVEFHLTDANGRLWTFIEKVPVISQVELDAQSVYPQPGFIACEILAKNADVVTVDTQRPWGIESTDGQTQFDVSAHAVVERGP
jgi:hypothetical protein